MNSLQVSSKNIVFIAIMSALGNVLSALSITVSPIIPSIPLGPINVSLALDLSHITTFIASLFGGPIIGGLTGMIGGMVAAYTFGFSSGNLVTGFGLPIGKALTGITAGLIMNHFRVIDRQKIAMILTTTASYIPEGVFTALVFIAIFPLFYPYATLSFLIPFTVQIIIKACFEMVIMGLILSTMIRNQSFTSYIKSFFTEPHGKK
jgi:hypothetical protein